MLVADDLPARAAADTRGATLETRLCHTFQQGGVYEIITEELLSLALDCLPPADLERLFRRLLLNIREHRSGFPDLIRFLPNAAEPDKRYEMIEVKGPGDRLQDHQIRWLEFFAVEGIPASVCYVRWQASEAME